MANYAKKVLLAQTFDSMKNDPSNWWMSEKLDGWRAYWDGSQFYTRNGNLLHAPAFFTETLPKVALDGELWCGRGMFQKTSSILQHKNLKKMQNWQYVRFLVFDAPWENKPYEERMLYVEALLASCKAPSYARPVKTERCTGSAHLNAMFQQVISLGGEGLMLRKPNSMYEWKRSNTLLKCKLFTSDEALVQDIVAGDGRLKTVMGSLQCMMSNGKKFSLSVGFSDNQRRNPPRKGAIVEFKFQDYTDDGLPRFPSFKRIRTDITWSHVKQKQITDSLYNRVKNIKSSTQSSKQSIMFETETSNETKTIVEESDSDDDLDDSQATNSASVILSPPPMASSSNSSSSSSSSSTSSDSTSFPSFSSLKFYSVSKIPVGPQPIFTYADSPKPYIFRYPQEEYVYGFSSVYEHDHERDQLAKSLHIPVKFITRLPVKRNEEGVIRLKTVYTNQKVPCTLGIPCPRKAPEHNMFFSHTK